MTDNSNPQLSTFLIVLAATPKTLSSNTLEADQQLQQAPKNQAVQANLLRKGD